MNLIDKVKAIFAEVNKVKMSDGVFVKTDDGKIFSVKTPTLAVDSPIVMIDEAGAEQQIEDGDYTLDDNTVISIANGIVTNIVPVVDVNAAAVVTAPDEVEAPINVPDSEPATEARLQELEADVEELEAQVAELQAALATMTDMNKVNKANYNKVKLEFEKLKSTPAVVAIDTKKFEKTDDNKNEDSLLSKVSLLLNKNKK